MNVYVRVSRLVYSHRQWLRYWPVITEVLSLSQVIGNDSTHFLYCLYLFKRANRLVNSRDS